ncbi:MAG: hypothetical protein IJN70_08715, partial [Clostridia bacterium]|nr:hypothetical protein [Clostridia bacterium]
KNHSHHDLYYTEAETDNLISQAENRASLLINDVQTLLSSELSSHNHDNRYYTREQSDNNLLSFRDTAYAAIMQEINGKLAGKSNTNHTHRYNDLTEAPGDYVMDQNAGAGWFYHLWDSGVAELWGNFSVFHSTMVAAGDGFSTSLALPFALMDNDYYVSVQPTANAEKIRKAYLLTGTESLVTVYIKLESSADGGQNGLGLNETVGLNIHLIGRWR